MDLLLALPLFPSVAHYEMSVGPYAHTVAAAPLDITALPDQPLSGLTVRYGELELDDDDGESGFLDDLMASSYASMLGRHAGTKTGGEVRVYVDEQGTLQLDQLSLNAVLASYKIRRELGDYSDLQLLGGSWENTRSWQTDNLQLTAIVPSNLTLLGFSDTDMDSDSKLKHYISIGSGAGGEILARIVGPVGLYARTTGMAKTLNRHRKDAKNYVRHELSGEAAVGLALLRPRVAVTLTGWAELVSQWETRDADGRSGVDRQYAAWGLALSGRLYGEAYVPATLDLSTPEIPIVPALH